jgi:hypothetical protein
MSKHEFRIGWLAGIRPAPLTRQEIKSFEDSWGCRVVTTKAKEEDPRFNGPEVLLWKCDSGAYPSRLIAEREARRLYKEKHYRAFRFDEGTRGHRR